MENQEDIQIRLIRMIREQVPEHVSLVDEMADLLQISNDSAYRRLRGEKQLSLRELQKLAGAFQISLDGLLGNPVNSVTFRTNFLDERDYSFTAWLKNLLQFTREAARFPDAEAIFILNGLNIFQIIQFPEICAFKLFFWRKSNLDFPGYRKVRFRSDDLDEEILSLSKKIVDYYVKIRTREFTTEETLNSFLKQVMYYAEADYFRSREDALQLCEKLHELVDHHQRQATLGFKFPHGSPEVGEEGNFQLFHNDIILADNTILIKAGDFRTTFLTCNAINLMHSSDEAFFEYNYSWGRNLLAKSVPISGMEEKERNRFFKGLHSQIDDVKERI